MNTKNILIVVAIVLCVGLAIVMFLSFQIVNDTGSAVKNPFLPFPVQKNEEKASIYGLDLPLGEKKVVHVYGKENPKEGEPSTPIPQNHIKTYELEKAELSTGVQPEQAPSLAAAESQSTPQSSTPASVTGGATGPTQNGLNPTPEQIRDLQKKGIVIF